MGRVEEGRLAAEMNGPCALVRAKTQAESPVPGSGESL